MITAAGWNTSARDNLNHLRAIVPDPTSGVPLVGTGTTTAAFQQLAAAGIASDAVTRAKLEAVLQPPYGMIQMFGGPSATAPKAAGWLLCDGTAVSRTTYASLFTAIGTAFGSGNGSTTFNLPDFRARLPVGVSASFTLGLTGGSFVYDLTHTHSQGTTGGPSSTSNANTATGGGTHGDATDSHTHSGGTTGNGGGSSVAIVPPYLAVNFYIYSGVAS